MNNSLRVMGISLVLWCGLGIGLANAATTIASSKGNEAFAALEKNVSVAMVGMADTAAPILTKAVIQEPSSISNAAGHAVGAGKNAQISAHQTYAMLLVGLGMLFFSARQRTNAI